MEKSQWQIYTGDGKGKTTAATGLVTRALGCGKRVMMMQFFKNGESGEIRALKKLGLEVDFGEKIEAPPWDQAHQDEWREHAKTQFEKAKAASKADYDLLVLDEIMIAVNKGFIDEDEVIDLAKNRNPKTELLTTGRGAGDRLKNEADLVTEMRMIKHYADSGIEAREGIEF